MDDDIREIRRQQWLRAKRSASLEDDNKSNSSNTGGGLGEEDGGIRSTKKKASLSPSSSASRSKRTSKKTKMPDVIDLTDDNNQLSSLTTRSTSFRKPQPKQSKTSKKPTSFPSSNIIHQNNQHVPIHLPLASYNIWFGSPHPTKRMQKIASILTSSTDLPLPLFIGLQEVTPQLAHTLFPLLMAKGYDIHFQDDVAYGCAIAVKISSIKSSIKTTKTNSTSQQSQLNMDLTCEILQKGFVPYHETCMARGLLWVHARINHPVIAAPKEIIFTTTHLESYMRNYPSYGQTYEGSVQRASQIRQASAFCEEYLNNNHVDMAIITGDMNWDDERKRSKGIDKTLLHVIQSNTWKDAWLEGVNLRKIGEEDGVDGYTYDGKLNPMLKNSLRRRFDRCLFYTNNKNKKADSDSKSQTMAISIESVCLIGKSNIDGLKYRKEVPQWNRPNTVNVKELPLMPSDHYGLFVILKLEYSSSASNVEYTSDTSSSSPVKKRGRRKKVTSH